MIRHYLELAWQQLEKYRLQSVVSIVSLGIGFACFALAAMWIKYETTYDAFHRDAEQIHVLTLDNSQRGKEGDIEWLMHKIFTDSVYKHCPEIVEQTFFYTTNDFTAKGKPLTAIAIDSSFLDFFDIHVILGGDKFLQPDGGIAITQEKARELWGDEDPIGKEVELPSSNIAVGEMTKGTITAVIKGTGEHTNFPFDLLYGYSLKGQHARYGQYVVRLIPQARLDDINMRIRNLNITHSFSLGMGIWRVISANGGFEFIPATKFRHRFFYGTMAVQINHIYLFAMAGGLLILCGLLNYLTMFINRLFIRQREIALRTVFGAMKRDLAMQFLVEFGLVLFIAFALGIFFMIAVLPRFRQLAELPDGTGYVYREGGIYMLLVIAVSLLISSPIIRFFRRQALQNSIQSKVGMFSYNNFRKLSICMQVSISILFIFCTVVMLKQIDTLRHTDIGFERKDMGIVKLNSVELEGESSTRYDYEKNEAIYNYLKQQPEVVELIQINPIFPFSPLSTTISKRHQRENYYMEGTVTPDIFVNPDMVRDDFPCYILYGIGSHKRGTLSCFYNLQLVEGRFFEEGDDQSSILINQSTARQFHWASPIGKSINILGEEFKVVGLIKDFLNFGPTISAKPYIIFNQNVFHNSFILKYRPGTWKVCKEKLNKHFEQYSSVQVEFLNVEEEYEKLLESEKNLQMLLFITAGTCILIALFGVWSMIMLTCEQRRKEIAIRKVFGATTKDILDMFFIEYMSLQGVAALVAFPIGYACMKPWLEQYVVQTEISWWIYVGIFLAVALLVALCVGWRVWRTAKARPADEICKG